MYTYMKARNFSIEMICLYVRSLWRSFLNIGLCSSLSPTLNQNHWFSPQSTHRGRGEIRLSVSALSAGAHTTTLYVMVDIDNRGVRPRPTTHQPGIILPS